MATTLTHFMKPLTSMLLFSLPSLSRFSSAAEQCHGTQVVHVGDQFTGVITDGDGSEDYTATTTCEWRIVGAEISTEIHLIFTEFDTELGFDFVRVFDGGTSNTRLLLEASGQAVPKPVTSEGRIMTVLFSSDETVQRSGFSAVWEAALPRQHHVTTPIPSILQDLSVSPSTRPTTSPSHVPTGMPSAIPTSSAVQCSGSIFLDMPSGLLTDGSGGNQYAADRFVCSLVFLV